MAKKRRRIAHALPDGIWLRGRHFSPADLEAVEETLQTFADRSRTSASIAICERLGWCQPNGWPKERACRDVLLALEKAGLVRLPPRRSPAGGHSPATVDPAVPSPPPLPVEALDFASVSLTPVKGTKREAFWNALVGKYHYLGYKTFVGRSLKYLIETPTSPLGAIAFADPAWNVAPRDERLQAVGLSKDDIRLFGINNVRFLILPWVRVPNLASHVLATAVKRVVKDWSDYYAVRPRYVETFVDPLRFPGTCYLAANWVLIGQTRGYRKRGNIHSNSQAPKLIFLSVLDRKLRRQLAAKAGGGLADAGPQ